MPSRILPELLTKASWRRGSVLTRRSRSTNESLGRLAFAVVLAVVLMYDTPGRRRVHRSISVDIGTAMRK